MSNIVWELTEHGTKKRAGVRRIREAAKQRFDLSQSTERRRPGLKLRTAAWV
jgi:hypothetical protein